jgi:hypothetical protein
MYRPADLQTCLFGLVGFHQNQNPDYPTLPPSLLASSSGLYIQDEQPLLSIENIDQALKNYDAFNYLPYNALTAYATGDKIKVAGVVYESLEDQTGVAPPGATWEVVGLLAQRLDQVLRSAITKVVSAVFQQKKLDGVTKSIFENVQLFDGVGDLTDKEIKAGRFVGYQIAIESYRDLSIVLKRLGTQFSGLNPGFELYLYHSSQEEPIQVFELNLTKANSFQWSPLKVDTVDFVLRYLSDDYAPGGCFYLGYYEDDLVGQAINRGYRFDKAPACSTCGRSYEYYTRWSPYMAVTPIAVPAEALAEIVVDEPRKLWDLRYNQYEYSKNYGLNLDLSVYCDVTDFLCREKDLFVDPILKQVRADLLYAIAYSTRNNPIAKEVRDLALYELDNRPSGSPGSLKLLEKAIAAVNFDLSDLNDVCLPCNDSKGPSWGSV